MVKNRQSRLLTLFPASVPQPGPWNQFKCGQRPGTNKAAAGFCRFGAFFSPFMLHFVFI